MRKPALLIVIFLAVSTVLHASTFVVPTDRDMVLRSDAIVIGSALTSYTQLTSQGGVETVTPISIEEAISGGALPDLINVVEPGGRHGDQSTIVPGSPQFEAGERVLLLLRRTGKERWAVAELVLGKFTFASDAAGLDVLVRDEDEITGWDPDLREHQERHRGADGFLRFVRSESHGTRSTEDYFVATEPIVMRQHVPTSGVTAKGVAVAAVSAFSANSYTMLISGSTGARWNVFPNAVTVFSGASGEPGAPGNGTTAVTVGLGAWTNDSGSNVNYVYGGSDSTHTRGLSGSDGANTVLFERDLSAYGVSPFTCSGSGYSGTLGIGGITSASGTNVVNGETFTTTTEGDVEMNRGIANCTLLFSNGDFNSALAHELGHTLGFRHADQNRSSNGPCSSDPSLECSTQAIMKSFISSGLNAALQPWDVNAVRAVYPGASSCTAPSITAQPQSATIPAGSSATLRVTATGTTPFSYQWYTGASGNTSSPFPGGTGSSITVSSAGSYWVHVTNSCGSVNSAAATVTVTQSTGRRYVHDDYNGDGRADFAVYRPSNSTWLILGGATVQWGSQGDMPVPADYDGDRRTDIAVYRPSTGVWLLRFSSNGTTPSVQWGSSGDIPVPGDYDGDGKADVAVYRPSTGVWFLKYSSNGTTPSVQFGSPGDKPVPGDYDGDGRTDLAVYRPSSGVWYYQFSRGGGGSVQFGSSGDIPVPRDYDGDGRDDFAVYRPSTGVWFFLYSSGGGGSVQFGSSGDIPIPGDYNGDSRSDFAVYRPSTSVWYYNYTGGGGGSTKFGSPGDTPLNQ